MTSVKNKNINKFENLKYSIVRIKTLAFFINEHFFINDPQKEMKIEFSQLFGVNLDVDIIDFRLRIYFFYVENKENIVAEIIAQSVFKIEDLKKYADKDKKTVTLPPELIVAITSLSISHSRALLSQNLAGTILQHFILPIANATEVAKQFFKDMFDENGNMKKETTFNLTPPVDDITKFY